MEHHFTRALLGSFEELMSNNGDGDPENGAYWTYLSITEIISNLKLSGFAASRKMIKKLLKQYKIGRRKIAKAETMKSVEVRIM